MQAREKDGNNGERAHDDKPSRGCPKVYQDPLDKEHADNANVQSSREPGMARRTGDGKSMAENL